MFNPNKPFKRRDGKEVLWWKILKIAYADENCDRIIYAIETDKGNHILQEVSAKTGLQHDLESMRESDLINEPEYEYRLEYLDSSGIPACGKWFSKQHEVGKGLWHPNFVIGIRRRPKESPVLSEWEIIDD